MIIDTRNLGAIEVSDVGTLGFGLSIVRCPGVADASDTNGRKYLETSDLQRVDTSLGLARAGVIGGEWWGDHFRKEVDWSVCLGRVHASQWGPLNGPGRRS